MAVNKTIKGFVDESLELSFDTIHFLTVKKKKKKGWKRKKKKKYCTADLLKRELNIKTYSNVCLSLQTAWTVAEKGTSCLHPSQYVSSET